MRVLRPIIMAIDTRHATYIQRTGSDARTVSPPGAFDLVEPCEAPRHAVSIPTVDGVPVTDTEFDTATNGPRVVDLPPVGGEGVREWISLEVLPHDEPTGTARLYRVNDGTTDLWWDGVAWSPATDPVADWSPYTDIADNMPTLYAERAVRLLTLRVWLSVADGATASPSVEGMVIGYRVRDQGDEDDALLRTVLRTMRQEISSTFVYRTTSTGGPFELHDIEQPYDLIAVDEVHDLDADPDEQTAVSGTWVPVAPDAVTGFVGSGVWTPDVPIPVGHSVVLYGRYRPHMTASLHRGAVEVERMPQVLLLPGGRAPRVERSVVASEVRRLDLDPPQAIRVSAPDHVEVSIDVRINGDLSSDVRRIGDALRAWVGGYRAIVSPETGRIVTIREVGTPRTTSNLVGQGVAEQRAEWLIGYLQTSAIEATIVHLTRAEGVILRLHGG